MQFENKEQEILFSATELFMKFGIKSLTMDDISRNLGISKKTLYQYVSDKNDLVKKGITLMIEDEEKLMCTVLEESDTAIDELMGITKCGNSKLGEMHPSVIFDLQKYHPKAWEIIENHKLTFIYETMLENLKRGVKEGVYRDNLNPVIIANIYMGMIHNMLSPDNPVNKSISMDLLHLEITRYHIKGIANDEGLKLLKEVLKREDNNHLLID